MDVADAAVRAATRTLRRKKIMINVLMSIFCVYEGSVSEFEDRSAMERELPLLICL